MNIQSPVKKYAPTVFVFDDDSATVDIVSRGFLRDEKFGLVSAQNVQSALKILRDPEVEIDVFVSDISIMPQFRENSSQIMDGIDLASEAQKIRSGLKTIFLSVYADETMYRNKAEAVGINVEEWLEKNSALASKISERSVWKIVEQIVYSVPPFDQMKKFDEKVLTVFLPEGPLFEDVFLKVPAELYLHREDGVWIADAIGLGIVQPAVGDSVREAIKEMREIIANNYTMLINNTNFGSESANVIVESLTRTLAMVKK
jgi:CheY-like chemotaxis protein